MHDYTRKRTFFYAVCGVCRHKWVPVWQPAWTQRVPRKPSSLAFVCHGQRGNAKFLLLHDFTATQLTFCRDAKCNLLSFEVSFSHLVEKIFGAVRWIHRQNLFLHIFMVV